MRKSSLMLMRLTSRNVDNNFLKKSIKSLLLRSHQPLVEQRMSTIQGAGYGVFVVDDCYGTFRNIGSSISKGQILSLYPGTFTPGLPSSSIFSSLQYDDEYTYLASGNNNKNDNVGNNNDFENNAYILNLSDNLTGGYIDGKTIEVCNNSKTTTKTTSTKTTSQKKVVKKHRLLNENPSACGHLINHGGKNKSNVDVISFRWIDILGHTGISSSGKNEEETYYDIPNVLRSDGKPWYFDNITGTVHYFPCTNEHDDDDYISPMLYGAAIYAKEDISANEEILLDYGLSKPYPKWAIDWYEED